MTPGRKAAGLLAVLLAVLPASALTTTARLDFATPAQAEADASIAQAHWGLFIFPGTGGNFHLSAPGGASQTNTTVVRVRHDGAMDNYGWSLPLQPQTTALGAFDAEVGFNAGWAALLVLADNVSVATPSASVALDHASAGQLMEDEITSVHYPPDTMPPFLPPSDYRLSEDQAAVAVVPSGAVSLHVSGVHRLFWHNVTVACHSGTCPDSGRSWEMAVPAAGTAAVQQLSYIQVDAPGAFFDGSGRVLAFAVGGPSIAVGLQGKVRFPDASLQGTCGGHPCPDPSGRTFLAQGNLTLDGLTGARPGRLGADLSGSFTSASFDEAPALAFTISAGVGIGVAAVGVAVLARVLAGLFSRELTPDKALSHPRRGRLYDAIRQHPGATYRFLMEAVRLSDGVTRHHLKALARSGLIVARRQNHAVHYFENHGRYDANWKPTAALRDPSLRALHEWIANHPGAQQSEVIAHGTHALQCSSTAVRKCLRRLEEWGLVASETDGRTRTYAAR